MISSFKKQVELDVKAVASADAAQVMWARVVTAPLSWVFAAATLLRNKGYDLGLLPSVRLPGRVVSVGNIALGGTGKSPVVMHLAESLLKAGKRPAILTRGYGSGLGRNDALALLNGNVVMRFGAHGRAPDEATMQSCLLPEVPVVAGPRRAEAARRFLEERPDLAPTHWLLDDGFQHRRIARDLDIVLLDGVRPFAGGRLLPRGGLRESPSALKRADLVIFTRATATHPDAAALARVERLTQGPIIKATFASKPLRVSVDGKTVFDPKVHAPVAAACGIANPDDFLAGLGRQGVGIGMTYVVGDHQPFSRPELERKLVGAAALVTTAKDYWRDPEIFGGLAVPVFVQELGVDLDDRQLGAVLTKVLAP